MKKFIIAICCMVTVLNSTAQQLKTFTLTLQPDSKNGKCYISIQKEKAFTKAEATAEKASINFFILYTVTQYKDRCYHSHCPADSFAFPKEIDTRKSAQITIQ